MHTLLGEHQAMLGSLLVHPPVDVSMAVSELLVMLYSCYQQLHIDDDVEDGDALSTLHSQLDELAVNGQRGADGHIDSNSVDQPRRRRLSSVTSQSTNGHSTFTAPRAVPVDADQLEDLLAVVEDTASDQSSHSKTRSDCTKQRQTFRALSEYINSDEEPRETLTVAHNMLRIEGWNANIRPSAMREVLQGAGLSYHLLKNPVMDDMFDVYSEINPDTLSAQSGGDKWG